MHHSGRQREDAASDYGFLDDTASSASTAATASAVAAPVGAAIRKGLLWQQRDRLFSRWKERFFVLTADYLQCFRRAGTTKITEMGAFVFKVRG